MNDWNIQSRAHTCQGCGKSFADKQPYHTVLSDQRHQAERLDFCQTCWKKEHEEGARDRKGFISHWQGVYQAPPPAAPDAIRKENAETLLRRMMELNDVRHTASSYILAVMLERKRILKVKEQYQRENQRIFVYEHAKTGDIFTIPDPALQLNQLEAVQREVALLLEQGLEPGVAPAEGTQANSAPSAGAEASPEATLPEPSTLASEGGLSEPGRGGETSGGPAPSPIPTRNQNPESAGAVTHAETMVS